MVTTDDERRRKTKEREARLEKRIEAVEGDYRRLVLTVTSMGPCERAGLCQRQPWSPALNVCPRLLCTVAMLDPGSTVGARQLQDRPDGEADTDDIADDEVPAGEESEQNQRRDTGHNHQPWPPSTVGEVA